MDKEFLEYVKRFNLTEDDLLAVGEAGTKMTEVMKEIIEKSSTDETKRIALGVLTVRLLKRSSEQALKSLIKRQMK